MKTILIFLCVAVLCIPAIRLIDNRGDVLLASIQQERYNAFPYTVVLDAGHGGEDGGAVALDGTLEKDLNLAVSLMIADYFELFGIGYRSVRNEDTAVGDASLSTVRERKTSDIKARFSLVEETENGILLSIHQNKFTQAKYSGLQVFYSPNDELSARIAEGIQRTVSQHLQPDNHRETKASGDSIYLLYHAVRPSVLVECGFVSNETELQQLKNASYQSALSYFIIKGFLFGVAEIS